jgi:photosystem II stability/assembly factor-like uncharacterized protein
MGFAVAAVAVAAVLAIGAVASARGNTHGVPHGFRPQTAAAVGSRDYWVLGYYPCGGTSCAALVRSTDRGRHFERIALPWYSPRETIPSLMFLNARLGYLLGGRLYVTHDGGTTWRPSGPKDVLRVAVGGGDIYVLSKNRFERSRIGRSSWQTVSLPMRYRFLVSLAARGKNVWLLGSTSHIRAGDFTLRSTDRGTTFKKSHGPCIPGLAGELVPAGRTFPRYRSFHDPGGTSLPTLTNGAAIFPSSPRDAVVYRGAQGPLFRTADMGRHWVSVRGTGRFEQLFWLHFATSRVGAALFTTKSHPNQASLWRTTDRGATWHSMPIR